MDKFEKFVKNNRNVFDDEMPSMELKGNILKEVNTVKKVKTINLFRYWVAAAAILFLIVNIGILEYLNSPEKKLKDQLSQINPEYIETDNYYKKQIILAKNDINITGNENEIIEDVEEIDNSIFELKKELVFAPIERKKVLANTIISSYRTQLKILKKVSEKKNKYL